MTGRVIDQKCKKTVFLLSWSKYDQHISLYKINGLRATHRVM